MKWIIFLLATISICCLFLIDGMDCQQWSHHRTVMSKDIKWKRIVSDVKNQLKEKGVITDTIGQMLHNFLVALKLTNFPTAVGTNVSQQCKEDSQLYVHSLYGQNLSLWALQMQESSGHWPYGLLKTLNSHADGLFDECQDVKAPTFQGKYCTVAFSAVPINPSEILLTSNEEMDVRARNPLEIIQLLGLLSGSNRVEPKTASADAVTYTLPSISFCVPSSCSAQDLGRALAEMIGGYVISNESLVTIADEGYCFKRSNDPPSFDAIDITVIVIFSVLGLLVITATVHEGWRMYRDVKFDGRRDGFSITALHCFSVVNNGRKLLSMKVLTASSDNFGCIHGIRVFSTVWVVMGHFWSVLSTKLINPLTLYYTCFNWQMQSLLNAYVSVDTFFLMSGLLVSYLLLRELERNKGRINIGLFYLHRYIRLTVVYAFILAFVASLMVYTGTGPNWFSVALASNHCRMAWWRQFLYINNLFPYDDNFWCMGQSWYLAADMQMYLISPLLIYPLWRWRRAGKAWMAFVTLAIHVVVYTLYIVHDFLPTMMVTRSADSAEDVEFYDVFYVKPWARAPPYLIGIWIGYYLHVTKNNPKPIPKVMVAVGWCLSTVMALAIVYGLTPYLDETEVPDIKPIVKFTYGPLHRTAWGMVIGWIIVACSRGYGGFVNRFLSWKGFLPLGRLTYCVYLIHDDFITVVLAANRRQLYYTFFGEFLTFLGILVISFSLAFVASVTIEASFLNLEKLVFPPSSKLSKKEVDTS